MWIGSKILFRRDEKDKGEKGGLSKVCQGAFQVYLKGAKHIDSRFELTDGKEGGGKEGSNLKNGDMGGG